MRDFDLVVIGAGVAGLTAAMHAARYGLSVAVVERMGVGGQIAAAERIENFPGFPQGLSGAELGPLLHEQAEAAGAEFVLDTVEGIAVDGEWRVINGASEPLRTRAVIVAAGSALKSLGVPGEETFLGRGVSHCASCDGHFFSGQDVCVIGGGDSALDEALVLTEHAARVAIIHRGATFDAQRALIDRAAANGKIEIVPSTAVEEIIGTDSAIWGPVCRFGNSTIRPMPIRRAAPPATVITLRHTTFRSFASRIAAPRRAVASLR